jgi:hypothetical protein
MSTVDNLDCTILFPNSAQFAAAAQLAECEIGNHKFWFGVVRIAGLNQDLADRFRMTFEDGRTGAATSGESGITTTGYTEISFLGVTDLC